MRLQELLPPEHIVIGLEAADKWEVIDRLIAHLVARGAVPGAQGRALQEAVLQRERSMSTGMERGIAIPHAAVDGLERVVAAMAVIGKDASGGVPFDSIDASPAWIVVLLLIPRQQKLVHIRTLADLARHFGNEETRRALRAAKDSASAWKTLAKA
ncbi:MAG: PTS sugar transporter subunit IIA [Planctomycetota bacterium]